ncbi:unnamed protein product [Arabidopsis thaliana]|uniref:(thale cress) hypothetical protein n=1 Tax=Arabidopsis thaliana TaxID=3702 RepID=A0A7G2F2B2_ARATH|nr:unnamed protein product [Arabidopsis thaliana]
MAMEISVDLINQLKVSLRKEAKLTSVDDCSDSSFPSLPTSEEAIAELDASAPYLRCRNCKGKLLRGIESLICVFCGNQQRTSDNPPDPIKFTSTSAYKWFLTSLNLDGSEMVEPLKETDGSSRGATKAPPSKGIALSKFLDLEIQWSALEEKSDDGQSVQKKNPLNLGGINLDDYFVERRGDLSKVEQAESKPVEDDDFKDPRSLSLFDSVKSQGVVGSQQHDNKKIDGDPFVSSPVDLAAHMDSVFGSGKDLLYAQPADSSTAYVSKAGDWLQDDLFGNVTGEAQTNDSAVHDKNEGQIVGGNGNSSMDIDWIGDDLWQTNEKKSIEKTPTDVNDDDDDDWNDFASSANSKTPNNPLSQTMESSQFEIFYGHAQDKNGVKEQSVDEKQNTDTSVMSDIGKCQEDDLFGTWDSFTSSTILQTSLQPPTIHANPSGEKNPEMNLFGENNNNRDLDFDSISRSDFFSESSGGKTNSEEVKVIPSGTSTLDRPSDPDGSKDQTVDLVVGTTTTVPKSKNDVAEELMSQMHDLSFMLETKLSVPPISKTE